MTSDAIDRLTEALMVALESEPVSVGLGDYTHRQPASDHTVVMTLDGQFDIAALAIAALRAIELDADMVQAMLDAPRVADLRQSKRTLPYWRTAMLTAFQAAIDKALET